MNVTWIRHGEKIYKNGYAPDGSHHHDPPLKRNVKYKIKKLCEYLDESSGIPVKIITSPFDRTRDTAKMIRTYYKEKYNKEIEIIVDNNIGEFLGWMTPTGDKADVSDKTNEYIRPSLGLETLEEVKLRSEEHVKELNYKGFVVVVTHGIIINYIHKFLTGYKFNKVKELTGISLNKNRVDKIRY